jgi:hypothetical protein
MLKRGVSCRSCPTKMKSTVNISEVNYLNVDQFHKFCISRDPDADYTMHYV